MASPKKYHSEAERAAAQRVIAKVAARKYYDRNRDKIRARARALYALRPKRSQARRALKKKYGEGVLAFVDSRQRCPICSGDFSGTPGSGTYACVDHCHECGDVRDMVCRKCNVAIGLLQDSSALLRLAAKYLEKHDCRRIV